MALYDLKKDIYIEYSVDGDNGNTGSIKKSAHVIIKGRPMPGKDIAILKMDGDSTLPTGLGSVTVPTVVLTGSDSGAWAETAAHALTAVLPTGSHHVLDGQNHAVAWDVLAAALAGVRVTRTDPRS